VSRRQQQVSNHLAHFSVGAHRTRSKATAGAVENMQATLKPQITSGTKKVVQEELAPAADEMAPMPAAQARRPSMTLYLPPMRSARRPPSGDTTKVVTAKGAMASPAASGSTPSTVCR